MELQELKGVGEATAQRIRAAGVDSVETLANASIESLTEHGLSDSKANRLVSRAKRNSLIVQSGQEAADEAAAKEHISSGMPALDDVIGDGYREGHIVGLVGPPSSGKTQMVFRALGSAVEQTGDPAIYIETERERFDLDRVAELSTLERDEIAEKVWRVKAYSLDQQRESYEAILESFDDVSLVAVDSFTARFRLSEQFEGRGSLTDRNAAMVRHLNGTERLVEALQCPALLTLQIMGNPTRFGSSESTWGGTLMEHSITYLLKMSEAQGQFHKATLVGHPSQAEASVLVSIGDELTAHPEK